MKCFRIVFWTCTFIVFVALCPKIQYPLLAQQQTCPKEKAVCFRWAFGALTVKDNHRILTPITGDTTLLTGDQYKIFLELRKDCFVYLIYQSSQNRLYMLFPHDLCQGYNILKKNFIPSDNQWFELDKHIGLETFYLLGSSRRLYKLESFFCKYKTAQGNQKEEVKQKIVSEINKLRRQHRKLKKYAERPVAIIGSRRSVGRGDKSESFDVANIAVEISAKDFYSRTFSIDHR